MSIVAARRATSVALATVGGAIVPVTVNAALSIASRLVPTVTGPEMFKLTPSLSDRSEAVKEPRVCIWFAVSLAPNKFTSPGALVAPPVRVPAISVPSSKIPPPPATRLVVPDPPSLTRPAVSMLIPAPCSATAIDATPGGGAIVPVTVRVPSFGLGSVIVTLLLTTTGPTTFRLVRSRSVRLCAVKLPKFLMRLSPDPMKLASVAALPESVPEMNTSPVWLMVPDVATR
jgi:hypothetical protein